VNGIAFYTFYFRANFFLPANFDFSPPYVPLVVVYLALFLVFDAFSLAYISLITVTISRIECCCFVNGGDVQYANGLFLECC